MKFYGSIKKIYTEGSVWIKRDDGKSDIWCHKNDLPDNTKELHKVEFDITENDKGLKAINLRNLDLHKNPFTSISKENFPEKTHQATTSNIVPFPAKSSPPKTPESDFANPHLKVKDGFHFYIVFNPMLNTDNAKDEIGITQAHSFNELLKKNNYLYWGKYKSSIGNKELDVSRFKRCLGENQTKGQSTILYISDFHHLWAAEVSEVIAGEQLNQATERGKTLEFYRRNWDKIEIWFKVTDMYLVSATHKETNEQIENLFISTQNNFNQMGQLHKDLHITPYTSNLRYPLIVENSHFEDYFNYQGKKERRVDLRNPLLDESSDWVTTQNIIYSYVIPKAIFNKIPTHIKDEIISTEILVKAPSSSRRQLADNAEKMAISYLRILEASIRNLIVEKFYHGNVNSLFKNGQMTLGSLQTFLSTLSESKKIKEQKPELYKVLLEISSFIGAHNLTDLRNDKIHISGEDDRRIEHYAEIRRIILGVGHKGFLNQLFYSFYEDELKEHFFFKEVA